MTRPADAAALAALFTVQLAGLALTACGLLSFAFATFRHFGA